MGKSTYIGASTTFVRAAGFAVDAVDPVHVAENAYYLKEKVKLDWQFLLIIGIFFGSLLSSTTDKSFKLESVPEIWRDQFGPSIVNRALASFVGGNIIAQQQQSTSFECYGVHLNLSKNDLSRLWIDPNIGLQPVINSLDVAFERLIVLHLDSMFCRETLDGGRRRCF
jgi:hypothetical protein